MLCALKGKTGIWEELSAFWSEVEGLVVLFVNSYQLENRILSEIVSQKMITIFFEYFVGLNVPQSLLKFGISSHVIPNGIFGSEVAA